jgi:PAS domain-containing protein
MLLDAEELLRRFMVDGMPVATLFKKIVGEVVERAKSTGSNRGVRIFGEMANLLWKRNLPAAIRVEEMWNEVIEASGVSLFCAYSMSDVQHEFPQTLCAAYSHMIPVAIIESSEDAIVGRTLDARIVSWNRDAERIYGYAANEAIGQPIAILLSPEGEDEVPAIIGTHPPRRAGGALRDQAPAEGWKGD